MGKDGDAKDNEKWIIVPRNEGGNNNNKEKNKRDEVQNTFIKQLKNQCNTLNKREKKIDSFGKIVHEKLSSK